MRIVACFKVSPEDQDIVARPDRTLSFDRAQQKIGAYDLNAIEAARRLADEVGGTVIGLSAGGAALANAKLTKDALSRGLDELVTLTDDALPAAESYQTASALAQGIAQIGAVDLVLVGAGSSDAYTQQVGNQLGALLGWPTLNAVDALTVDGDHVVADRLLEDAVQVVEVTLPAVLSLTSGINEPRIAGMKDILAAGKKPVTKLTLAEPLPAATAATDSILAPEQVDRGHVLFDGADAPTQLAAYLKSL